MEPGQPTEAREIDPVLGYAVRLALIAVPAAGLLLWTHSRVLALALAAVVSLTVLVRFPSPHATRLMAAALVLAPDAVVVGHLGGSPVPLRAVAFLISYAALLLALLRGRLRLRVPSPLLLTALLLAGLVGAVQNDRPRSLFEFGVLIVLPPVAGAILATDRDTALDFVRGLTAGTILLIGVAFTEALRNTNFLVASTVTGSFVRGDHIRTNAGWDYPTMLSAFLCLAGFFVVEALRQRWGFPGLVIGGALVTAAVITTQSRSGLLGLAAGALVYLLLQRRASQALAVVLGLAIAGGLLMVLPGAAPASFRDFVGQSFAQGSTANANVVYRRDLYSAAGRALADHPWFGFGYGSGKSVASNALHAYFGTMTDLASLPVSLAVQLGYVGGLAIGLFLLVVVIRVARTPDLPQRLPVAAGIVGCSGAMLGVPVSPPLTWMLLVAGLGWSMVKTHREAMRPGAPPVSDAPTIEPQPGSFVPGGEPATRPESGRW